MTDIHSGAPLLAIKPFSVWRLAHQNVDLYTYDLAIAVQPVALPGTIFAKQAARFANLGFSNS